MLKKLKVIKNIGLDGPSNIYRPEYRRGVIAYNTIIGNKKYLLDLGEEYSESYSYEQKRNIKFTTKAQYLKSKTTSHLKEKMNSFFDNPNKFEEPKNKEEEYFYFRAKHIELNEELFLNNDMVKNFILSKYNTKQTESIEMIKNILKNKTKKEQYAFLIEIIALCENDAILKILINLIGKVYVKDYKFLLSNNHHIDLLIFLWRNSRKHMLINFYLIKFNKIYVQDLCYYRVVKLNDVDNFLNKLTDQERLILLKKISPLWMYVLKRRKRMKFAIQENEFRELKQFHENNRFN